MEPVIFQFHIKLIPSRWYSEEGLIATERVFEKSIQLSQNGEQQEPTGTFLIMNAIRGQDVYSGSVKHLDLKKEQYGRGLGLCKKALNLAIENKSNHILEELLQQFIEAQMDTQSMQAQDRTLIDQHDISSEDIANPLQHKGKGRPNNKRFLSAIENNKNKDVQKTSDVGRKRNKRQCAVCKSWYHDSRNCPEKNKAINTEYDKENIQD